MSFVLVRLWRDKKWFGESVAREEWARILWCFSTKSLKAFDKPQYFVSSFQLLITSVRSPSSRTFPSVRAASVNVICFVSFFVFSRRERKNELSGKNDTTRGNENLLNSKPQTCFFRGLRLLLLDCRGVLWKPQNDLTSIEIAAMNYWAVRLTRKLNFGKLVN